MDTKRELEKLAAQLEGAARDAGIEPLARKMPTVLTADEPITHADEDRLNRTGFASSIAKAILGLRTEESLVIGIHGPWGAGKTSLLNLIKEQLDLEVDNPPLIMQFNPWGFSDQEQLTSQYFSQLAVFLKLHKADPILERIADAVQDYGDLLDPVARILTPRLREAVSFGQKLFSRFKPPKRTAVDLKSEISSALRRSRTRLVVMIDDIDRLNRKEIREVFQLVKVNANFANMVYLVSFDLAPVEKALRFVAPAPPRQYLYKIIQVAFSLPPVSEAKLTEMLLEGFNKTFSEFSIREIDSQRFGNMFHSGFRDCFHTLRDMNRFFNLYRFALGLMKDDTNLIDLAAIQCLAAFQPALYSAIERDSKLFTSGPGPWEIQKGEDKLKQAFEEIFEKVPVPDRKAVKGICEFLFPKAQSVIGNMRVTYGPEYEQSWQKDKRIASAKYFPYYFQLTVPETDVSQREMDAVFPSLTTVDSFVDALEYFEKSGRFVQFVQLLRNQLDGLTPSELYVVMESIFVLGDRVSLEGEEGIGLISDHIQFASWLLLDVLDRLQKGVRFQELAKAMTGKPAVYTVAHVAWLCQQILQDEGRNHNYREKYSDLNVEIVEKMREIAVSTIKSAAKDGSLQAAPGLPFILYRWKDWGASEGLSQWVDSTFLKSPTGAVKLVTQFSQVVKSIGLGDKVTRAYVTIDPRVVRVFADLNTVTALLEQVSDDKLLPRERDAKKSFLQLVTKINAGEELGTLDFIH